MGVNSVNGCTLKFSETCEKNERIASELAKKEVTERCEE